MSDKEQTEGLTDVEAKETHSKQWDGHRIAKIIYGTIIILTVVVGLEEHPPSPWGTVVSVILAGFAVALAELYSDIIGTRIHERRTLTWSERREITHNVSAVMIGALLPVPFFVLAALNIQSLEVAFVETKWMLIGVLLFYGYIASLISGSSRTWSAIFALFAGVIGIIVVLIKAEWGH